MKKIISKKLDIKTGSFVRQEEKIKLRNFDDGEATILFRQHLFEKGYKDVFDKTFISKKKIKNLLYPTIYGFPIKCKFATWQALKDSETGKAVLWVGNKNLKELKQEEIEDGLLINDRIIPTDCSYFGIVVVPRQFKLGTTISDADFVDYLLVPLTEIIEQIKKTNQGWIDIRKADRITFNAITMLPLLKQESESLYVQE